MKSARARGSRYSATIVRPRRVRRPAPPGAGASPFRGTGPGTIRNGRAAFPGAAGGPTSHAAQSPSITRGATLRHWISRSMARYVNTPPARKKRQPTAPAGRSVTEAWRGCARGRPGSPDEARSVVRLDDLRGGLDDEDLLRAIGIELHDAMEQDPLVVLHRHDGVDED